MLSTQVDFADQTYIESLMVRNPIDIGKKIDYFMATGNLVSQTGLDLMQVGSISNSKPYRPDGSQPHASGQHLKP